MTDRPDSPDTPEDPSPPTEEAPPEAPSPPPVAPVSPGVPWGLVLFLLLAVLLVVFTWQNTQEVELRFLAGRWDVPLAVLIIGVVVVSVILDEVLGYVMRRRRRRRAEERAELERLRRAQRQTDG